LKADADNMGLFLMQVELWGFLEVLFSAAWCFGLGITWRLSLVALMARSGVCFEIKPVLPMVWTFRCSDTWKWEW